MVSNERLIEILTNAKDLVHAGICLAVMSAADDYYLEKLSVKRFVKKHRPNIFSRFFWNKSYNKIHQIFGHNSYWWDNDQYGTAQRILFLDYLIDKVKNADRQLIT